MAFVLVQHLAPGHASMLSELVAKETDMPVLQAGDGMTVRPNHVYVMPPGAGVAILGGRCISCRGTSCGKGTCRWITS
jgi:two-component system CheB/CheR fusion protein